MPHVQLLAYCRYIQLWTLFYIFRIVNVSPLSSLIITSGLHLLNIRLNSKRIGIFSLDIIQILLIINLSKNFYIIENFFVFSIYINCLLFIDKNPISLYTIELKNDDELYKDENFINYIKRLSSYIILDTNKFIYTKPSCVTYKKYIYITP